MMEISDLYVVFGPSGAGKSTLAKYIPTRSDRPDCVYLDADLLQSNADQRRSEMSPTIQGFEQAVTDREAAKNWRPVSDRKIRVGIAGYGVCNFGAAFHFQDHPNVTVAAVADLDPEKCAGLAKACRCPRTRDGARACHRSGIPRTRMPTMWA